MTNLNEHYNLSQSISNTERMPVLFLGHGSPMNAIEENQFVVGFRNIAKTLPPPNAILCISAHWFTNGTKVTAMASPKTIHDFGGFPQSLFDVQYPAKGNPELAKETKVVLALEMHGLDRIKVEDLLESIFIIYYAQTELRKKIIRQISVGQIKNNIKWFEEFIKYYNEEKEFRTGDLSEIKFLRDNIVLDFALKTLRDLFYDSTKIPKEVIFGYFALLKAIEMGAEKE